MIKPLADKIVVKNDPVVEVSKGGLYLPDSQIEKPQKGTVVAVGRGKMFEGNIIPLEVSVGDRITYLKGTGAPITVDEEEYLIMREEDVIAIIPKGV